MVEHGTGGRPIVVGAGWSGLACAIALVRQGHQPLLLDAAPQAGGRARAVAQELGGATLTLDNGQHLLLGGYAATLEVLRIVGVDAAAVLARSPFALEYPDGWRLAAAAAPAPLHLGAALLTARRMPLSHRWSLAAWAQRQARTGWRIDSDTAADRLFAGEPAGLIRRLWRPLCLAALNVELAEASARVLLNVLRDSLGGSAGASNFLVPRIDLGTLFPDPAVRWLRDHGAEVRLQCPVHAIAVGPDGAPHIVRTRDGPLAAAHIVLALPPDRAAALLAGTHAALTPALAQLRAARYAPIATVTLRYPAGTRLRRPVMALLDDPASGHHGQWVFDRGALHPKLDGIVNVVISGDGRYREMGRDALGACVARQLTDVLRLPQALDHYALTEKHATLVPHPHLQRPPARLPVPGLYLAGDAADSPYPSTIEGSVRAGISAAAAAGSPGR